MKITNEKIVSTAICNIISIQFTNLHSFIYNFQNNLNFFHSFFTDLKLSGKALLHSIEKRNKHFHNLNAV